MHKMPEVVVADAVQLADALENPSLHPTFRQLVSKVEGFAAAGSASVISAFARTLFTDDAAWTEHNVVLVWLVDRPYQHAHGPDNESRVVYVEQTSSTAATRWLRWGNVWHLGQNREPPTVALSPDPGLRELALAHQNERFFRKLVAEHGALTVWWVPVSDLQQASGRADISNASDWEWHFLNAYKQARANCLPLLNKNRGVRPKGQGAGAGVVQLRLAGC